MPGPIAKKPEHRRRTNDPAMPLISGRATPHVQPPPAPQNLHAVAGEWYASLAGSGQAQFFEPSDWAVAQFIAVQISSYMTNNKFSANGLSALLDAMQSLGSTVASRRRLAIDLEKVEVDTDELDTAKTMDAYREMLGVA